jgi:hypothetical protein
MRLSLLKAAHVVAGENRVAGNPGVPDLDGVSATPGLPIFETLSNCDLGVCRYFFQGIFLPGKRP